MKNDLFTIIKRYKQIESDLLHGGYTGDLLQENIVYHLSDELLREFDPDDTQNLQKMLVNMFMCGGLLNELDI